VHICALKIAGEDLP
jgi:hypothetical protein